jgi:hypothetical protein
MFASFLNNIVTGIGCNSIQIHRIVEVIANYGIPPKIDNKVFETLFSICAVTRLRIYGVYCSRCNISRLLVGQPRCHLTKCSLKSEQ